MDELGMNYEKLSHSHHDLNMIFGDLEEVEEDSVINIIDRVWIEEEEEEEEEKDENASNADERRAFWESQQQLLQATLYRTTSFESKVRKATKDALRDPLSSCSCRRSCRKCRLKQVCSHLQNAGFNCLICISNWNASPGIPAGQHTYLEITESRKGDKMKVIIELNFKAEFEMARSNEEYKQLITKLPDVFVGKIERLRGLVKIMCGASKKCMKENKMHMAPWRKHNYMQAKWQLQAPCVVVEWPSLAPQTRRRASMLTFDFVVDTLHQNHAVEVI